MKTTLALLTICLLTQSLHAEEPRVIKVGTKPESVCRGFGGKLYVTMINGEEEGDGGINVVDDEGNVSEFCRGMNSPKGIAFLGKYLVTADETTMWKVNAKGKVEKLVDASDFPEAIEFLNDVAADRDRQGVYVAEMSHPKWMFDPEGERLLWPLDSDKAVCPGTGCIYHVSLEGQVTLAVPPGGELTGPNGVAVAGRGEKQQILMGDFFSGKLLSYNGKSKRVIADGMRGADGIEVGPGVIYVSSWPLGKVWKVDRKEKTVTLLSDKFTTAADLHFDRKNKQLIVPDMIEGTLTFLPVE